MSSFEWMRCVWCLTKFIFSFVYETCFQKQIFMSMNTCTSLFYVHTDTTRYKYCHRRYTYVPLYVRFTRRGRTESPEPIAPHTRTLLPPPHSTEGSHTPHYTPHSTHCAHPQFIWQGQRASASVSDQLTRSHCCSTLFGEAYRRQKAKRMLMHFYQQATRIKTMQKENIPPLSTDFL